MMHNSDDRSWYVALKAKDARFDGRFFVGVSSTGIYCRPICSAKLPKEEHCTFYDTAAAAEQAGYRPCLLCRPELSPGFAPIDATSALACKAAQLLEENCGNGQNIKQFVQHLGYSDRHLRRAFTEEFNVSPVQYLQTCRLLLAKNLLTDTDLSVIDVAMASGFGSLRRFNELFKNRYRLSPTTLRKKMKTKKQDSGNLTLTLGYRPPYQWDQILSFLAQRVIPGVEVVADDAYFRTVHYTTAEQKKLYGWIQIKHHQQKNALSVSISQSLIPALPHVLARVRNLFDLYCCPEVIYEKLSVMNTLKPALCVLGVRLPGCFEPFEMATRAVLGQQITVKAAATLAGRMAKMYGKSVDTGIDGLTHTFPSANDIANLKGEISNHLGPLGVIKARANTILSLARKIVSGEVAFSLYMQPEEEMKKLMTISGIGAWTAHYIALRAMNWPDAFPHTDYGVKKALTPRTEAEILQLAENWRPWRSYATINLWNSL